jgi:hypothetical protein
VVAATGSKATVLKSGMPLIPLFLKLTVPLDQPLKIFLINGIIKPFVLSLHGSRE